MRASEREVGKRVERRWWVKQKANPTHCSDDSDDSDDKKAKRGVSCPLFTRAACTVSPDPRMCRRGKQRTPCTNSSQCKQWRAVTEGNVKKDAHTHIHVRTHAHLHTRILTHDRTCRWWLLHLLPQTDPHCRSARSGTHPNRHCDTSCSPSHQPQSNEEGSEHTHK